MWAPLALFPGGDAATAVAWDGAGAAATHSFQLAQSPASDSHKPERSRHHAAKAKPAAADAPLPSLLGEPFHKTRESADAHAAAIMALPEDALPPPGAYLMSFELRGVVHAAQLTPSASAVLPGAAVAVAFDALTQRGVILGGITSALRKSGKFVAPLPGNPVRVYAGGTRVASQPLTALSPPATAHPRRSRAKPPTQGAR